MDNECKNEDSNSISIPSSIIIDEGNIDHYNQHNQHNHHDYQQQQQQQPLQITSIEGFFNRKRGRPPKNRFVEVYKNAQLSPQAIFTSFKLDKKQSPDGETEATQATTIIQIPNAKANTHTNSIQNSLTISSTIPVGGYNVSTTTTTTSKTNEQQTGRRERVRHKQRQPMNDEATNAGENICYPFSNKVNRLMDNEEDHRQHQHHHVSLERTSIVRAAGTFFPAVNNNIPSSSSSSSSAMEQPEDLSMKRNENTAGTSTTTTTTTTTINNDERSMENSVNLTEFKLAQFKQFLEIYQRQLLLPGFLNVLLRSPIERNLPPPAAAQPPPPPLPLPLPLPSLPHQLQPIGVGGADLPAGYLKFRFNENCGVEKCAYRMHQSHFHCQRSQCNYSFCDRARLVQHSARHDRLDELLSDDFRQCRTDEQQQNTKTTTTTTTTTTNECNYRVGQTTTSSTSSSQNKRTTHFHCRLCNYICSDSGRVLTHRRYHSKLAYVQSTGFRKIASNERCHIQQCTFELKQTHYHCMQCNLSVLSRAQLAVHQRRHRTITTDV